MELEYESKRTGKHWATGILDGCGCLLIILAICLFFNFTRILDLIEKIWCNQ